MTTPTLKVEVAFDDGALAVPTTWTDITNKVRAGSIRRGRSNELEQTSAGVLNLTLDNRVRTFDPFYASGPYYGKLTTRKQIRVTATYSGTDYPLFYGHVSAWPLSPDTSTDMVCQIEAYDWLSYLSTVQLPADRYTWLQELVTDDQRVWWPMGNNGRSCGDRWRTATKTSGYDYTFTSADVKTSGAPSEWMSGSATQFDGTYGAIGPAVKPSGTVGITFLVKTTVAGTPGRLNPILASANPNPDGFLIGIDSDGYLGVVQNTGLGAVAVYTSLPINDGNWHHVQISLDDATPWWNIWVDDVLLGYGTGYTGWHAIQLIGMGVDAGWSDPYFQGELAHIVIGQYGISFSGYELFRYGRWTLLDSFGYVAQTIFEHAQVPMSLWNAAFYGSEIPDNGGQKWNKSALQALQEIATTVGGRLYCDNDGVVILEPLSLDYIRTERTTVQATFSDSGAAGTIKYHDIGGIVFSDEFLFNQVTVTTADGSAFTLDDTTSQTAYGLRTRQVDTSLRNLTDATTLANQTLAGYSQPIMRFKDWKVAAHGQASAYPDLLTLGLAHRVKVEIIPNNVGSRLSQELFVEQITHEFSPGEWHVTLSGSPARTGWTLEDATYGLLESTTILG
jgi:hypothetical protein